MVLLSLEVLVIQGKGIALTISDVSFLGEEAPLGYFGSHSFLILSLRTWSELSFGKFGRNALGLPALPAYGPGSLQSPCGE